MDKSKSYMDRSNICHARSYNSPTNNHGSEPQYNYVLAAALDTGLAVSGIVIFFAITYGPNLQFPDWWGNTVWQNTADGLGTPWYQLPSIGYFGGANGTWS